MLVRLPQFDPSRLLRCVKKQWQRATHGTTRAAGTAMCVLMLCAVVVGGSQVLPFAQVREEVTETSEVSRDAAATDHPDDVAARLLERIDYNESWLQAGIDWDRLGDIQRRHQALLSPDGRLSGRMMTFADWRGDIGPLANTTVFLMQDGRVHAKSVTDADGRFVAVGLAAGTYSLIAQSENGVVAYALHLRGAAIKEEAREFEVISMAATAWDTDAVTRRVLEYWHSSPPIVETREPHSDVIPKPVRPIPQSGVLATTLSHHQVRLQDDGRLIGRLRRLHPETGRPIIARDIEVAIYRNGSLQGLTWTDEIGYFEFPRVAPGVYSLAATGLLADDPTARIMPQNDLGLKHGFLTLGIDVLPATDSDIVRVQHEAGVDLEIDAALVDLKDLRPFLGDPELSNVSTESLFTNMANPLGSGSAIGGPAGGGSGFAGGGGLAPLLGGAAGAGFGLLSDADDGVISNAQP